MNSKKWFDGFTPAIIWFFVVLVLICLPGRDIPSGNSFLELIHFDKWVHAGIFSVMAYLFMRAVALNDVLAKNKRIYFIRIAIATIVWGITTEFIQKFFVPGRSFDLWDWAADSAGVLIAFVASKKFFLK